MRALDSQKKSGETIVFWGAEREVMNGKNRQPHSGCLLALDAHFLHPDDEGENRDEKV